MQPTPLSNNQWKKVVKALVYSFYSGFIGGLALTATNYLQDGKNLDTKVIHSLVIAAVVGGVNTALVTTKQLFTTE